MTQAQRTTRRWLIVLGALWVLFFGAVAWALLRGGDGLFGLAGANEASAQAEAGPGDDAGAPAAADDDAAADQDAEGAPRGADDEIGADGGDAASDGWFTAAQASRGGSAFAEHCASCHGNALEGGIGPALAGDTFWARWEGDSVHTLFEVTRQTMPQQAPGSLPAETYADVVAHVLERNGLPEGDAELPPEAGHLQTLAIDRSSADASDNAAGADGSDAEIQGDAEGAGGDEAAATDADGPAAEGDRAANAEAGGRQPADAPAGSAEPARPAQLGDADWFSEAQVRAGEAVFAEHCARCHGAQLQGSPPLVGSGFAVQYGSAWELYQYTRQTMPQDAPGSLDDRRYLEAIAYVLHANGYPVGEQRLAPVRSQLASLALDAEHAGEPRIGDGSSADSEPSAEGDAASPAAENGADGDGDAAGESGSDDPSADAGEGESAEADDDQAGANGGGTASGAFSEEQAERGAEAYAQHCAQCHGDDLQGDPPLVGASFLGQHGTVGALYDYTREAMPQDDPGSLDDDTYADIIAHLLARNDFEPGDDELDPDDRAAMDDLALEAGSDAGGSDGSEATEGDAGGDGPSDGDAVSDGDAADGAADAAVDASAPSDQDEAEGPAPGRAWLEIDVRPEQVTLNLVGPDGFVGRASGAQTLRDLVPGLYLIAASRGHENATATVLLESGEHARVELTLPELARSSDAEGGSSGVMTEVPGIPLPPAEGMALGRWGATTSTSSDEDAPAGADAERTADEGGAVGADGDSSGAAPDGRTAWGAQATNGERAYGLHCARCHGATLEGNVAPPLAGEVFFERWAGHPVDWLYFQARASMPPHGPAFLSEQTYADIIVYTLSEAGVLEGFERFHPQDEEFRFLTIARTPAGGDAAADDLAARVDGLRDALHAPHAEAAAAPGLVPSIEWPDDPGIAPIGPPGWIPAEAATLPASDLATPDPEAADESDGDAEDEDDTTEDEEGGA